MKNIFRELFKNEKCDASAEDFLWVVYYVLAKSPLEVRAELRKLFEELIDSKEKEAFLSVIDYQFLHLPDTERKDMTSSFDVYSLGDLLMSVLEKANVQTRIKLAMACDRWSDSSSFADYAQYEKALKKFKYFLRNNKAA